jgi:hypothetical protein
MSKTTKTVKISESDLVNLIDNIVSEAVQIKKTEWLAEQASKGNKNSIMNYLIKNKCRLLLDEIEQF